MLHSYPRLPLSYNLACRVGRKFGNSALFRTIIGCSRRFEVSTPISTARQLLHRQPAIHTEELTQDKAKYPSPLTDRDTLTINFTKRSSVHCGHVEQRLYIEVSPRDGLQCMQMYLKLLERPRDDALSYSRVAIGADSSSWPRSMSNTQEGLADSSISVFSFEFRTHSRRCYLPLFNALPRPRTPCNNRILHFDRSARPKIPSLAMSAPLALRWSKADKARQALALLVSLAAAEKRRRLNFWTGNEPWMMWANSPIG
jgi:hypothetical protein